MKAINNVELLQKVYKAFARVALKLSGFPPALSSVLTELDVMLSEGVSGTGVHGLFVQVVSPPHSQGSRSCAVEKSVFP